jgi:hypothetical protein
MKNIKNKIIISIFLLIGLALISSCGEEHDFTPYESFDFENTANVKFIHTAIGQVGNNFQVNYFLSNDNTKELDKITSVLVTAGLPLGFGFGSGYPASINYATVKSGTQKLEVISPKIAATSTTPEVPEISRFKGDLITEKGKYYSNFLIGSNPTISPVVYETYQINDELEIPNFDKTKAYIRFINVINNTPLAGYDLGIIKTRSLNGITPVVTEEIYTYKNVTFKGGNEKFIAIEAQDVSDNRGYEIQLRIAGAPTNNPAITAPSLVAKQANTGGGIFVPRAGRIYTIYCRGFAGGVPSDKLNVPVISSYVNK